MHAKFLMPRELLMLRRSLKRKRTKPRKTERKMLMPSSAKLTNLLSTSGLEKPRLKGLLLSKLRKNLTRRTKLSERKRL